MNCSQFYEQYPFPNRIYSKQLSQQIDDIYKQYGREKLCNDALAILDIGCGTGEVLTDLAERYTNWKFTGIDLSRPSLELAQSCATDKGIRNVDFFCYDAQGLGDFFDPESFQVIQAIGSLHYLPNMFDVMREILSRLSKGGLFVLGVYNQFGRYHIQRLREAMFALLPNSSDKLERARLFCESFYDQIKNDPTVLSICHSFGLSDIRELSMNWLQDTFCHPHERLFEANQIVEKFMEFGLSDVRWVDAPDPSLYIKNNKDLSLYFSKPYKDQVYILERLAQYGFVLIAGTK